ncbi:MAG: glycosyltransferase family 4 protein, partial [Planctomycetes bacterium]|nr:glycosyltransferase family 4 protein [Planctomycetota bacterium]
CREIAELEKQGLDFEIFSLQPTRYTKFSPDEERLMQKTHYGSLLGASAIFAFLSALVRHPVRMVKAFAAIISASRTQPWIMIQSLGIIPLTLHFGRIMKARGITHTHGHWQNVPTTASWILHMVEGIPWSAAIHGENIFSDNPHLRTKLRDAKFIAVCTGYSCKHLKEKMELPRPDDIHLNYHGLDRHVWEAVDATEHEIKCANERPVIISIGRLFEFKGFRFLLKAVEILKNDGLDFELRIIGHGPQEEELRKLCAYLGIEDHVRFLGLMPFTDVLAEMKCADAFVLASIYMEDDHFDGIPNSIAEAMAFGKPVVSTWVSGIPELVEDGVSGLLVPEKNPEELANALRKILTDHDLASALGKAARPRVRALFDQQKNVSDLMELFHRYVGE